MNLRISAALAATVFAAIGLLAPDSKPNPLEAARLNNLGVAYMNQQLFEKGLKNFQQAAVADPQLAIARLNQGIALLNLQKVDEAKAALEEAAKRDPKTPNAWYNLGLLAKNTGDAQAAIDAFKRVIEIDANDADTWYFLGTSYVQAKQFPQAIDAFDHALKLNPLHASAEFGLSRAYQQSGNTEHAREHLKKFQYITQNKIGAPMSLAYGEQGQYSRAVESPSAVLKAPAAIKVRFVDVTKEAGIVDNWQSDLNRGSADLVPSGACFLDYDNDGRVDLLLLQNSKDHGLVLYHNLGDGKFEDVTLRAGLNPGDQGYSCTAGDYDNDGFEDIVIGTGTGVTLFHNEKNGTFKSVTNLPNLLHTGYAHGGLAFVDYDHDGDLDLFVTGADPDCIALTTPHTLTIEEQQQSEKRIQAQRENHNEGLCSSGKMWRNNGDQTFTNATFATGISAERVNGTAIGTDYNNDRAIDLLVASNTPVIFENPREGKFVPRKPWNSSAADFANGVAVLDYDHDGWMDVAMTHQFWDCSRQITIEASQSQGTSTCFAGQPVITLWRNNHGKSFEQVKLPETNWVRAFGVAAFDYDNDGWVDLVAVGETKEGKGEVRLFRNLGPDGFKDVTVDVGLDKIHLANPRAIITGDYDGDGATDLLITQNHGPAVLLRNEGGNQNHWLRLSLKGLNDNKSAIGTKVEVFSGGNRQKFEIYGSNGYLGQSSTDIVVGLGDSKEADIVRMLWPTGVLQDEIQVAGDKQQNILELDRRGSSCPTLFVWNGERYEFVADMLGAGVVGHWVGPGQRDIPRPVEWIKIPTGLVHVKPASDFGPRTLDNRSRAEAGSREPEAGFLSFRFMEPLEEAVYLDQVRLLAVDHPANVDVYPNEYFASNPPYPQFKVVVSNSRDARPPAGAWDEHGHDVLPDLLARRYFGDFALTQFLGFAKPHSLTLDLGEPYDGGSLWLLLHGEVEYFSANSMYAASQAGIQAIAPYVDALDAHGQWKRVVDDMGFPAGGPRTMTADLTGKLPRSTRKIGITT